MAISTIGASGLDSDVSQLGKNLIINGAMAVQQKGDAGAGIGGSGVKGLVDMFLFNRDSTPQARYTVTRETASGPDGAAYWLKFDVTTAEAAVAAGETQTIEHRIEAQDLQHLLYGTASAKTIAVTFPWKSSKTGTHCVALYQPDGTRSYIREFTVNSANTWETKTVTFPGDASGTINNDTGDGLRIVWPLVCGSDFQAAADGWAAGQDYATSNQQNLADNTANEIGLGGLIQLEVGSVATDFEHEDISTTLAKCQRYLRYVSSGSDIPLALGRSNTTTIAYCTFPLAPVMRAAPTLSFGAATDFQLNYAGASRALTALSQSSVLSSVSTLQLTISGGIIAAAVPVHLQFDGGGTRYLQWSAEL